MVSVVELHSSDLCLAIRQLQPKPAQYISKNRFLEICVCVPKEERFHGIRLNMGCG